MNLPPIKHCCIIFNYAISKLKECYLSHFFQDWFNIYFKLCLVYKDYQKNFKKIDFNMITSGLPWVLPQTI